MWYLDCYCWGALMGRSFPVNSYCSESLEVLIEAANHVLGSSLSGIDECRISRETKGRSPVPYYRPRLVPHAVDPDPEDFDY